MGSVTSLQDDGRAGGATPITVEATQSGSSGSNLAMDNAGNWTLAQWSGTVYTIIMQVIANAANGADNVKLGDSAHQVHMLGTLLANLSATFSGDVTINGTGTGLFVANSASIGGTLTIGTQLLLASGSLTRIASFGPYAVTNVAGGAFFNHNLGVIPDMVLMITDDSVRDNLPVVDFSTMTTTQIKLTCNTNVTARGIALKF